MRNISYDSIVYLKQKLGFTIVELLIVVVVIAILASITIVSYNGISKSARNSAIQSTLSQATKKIETYKINDTAGLYPSNLIAAEINLVNSSNTIYVYDVSSDSKLFCLASSQAGRTYYVSSTSLNPKPGICTNTTGISGTGDVAIDGLSTSSPAVFSIFNGQAPSGTDPTIYSDGGGSLRVGNRFYTTDVNGIKVKGLRVYNPVTSDVPFLSLAITAYAYGNDFVGSDITGSSTFATSPIATKVFSGTRAAGTWTDIMFDTPFDLPKVTSVSSPNDIVTLAVQYAGGTKYVFVSPSPNSGLSLGSVIQPGTYLGESSSLGRGVNTLVGAASSSYYGIDILFSTINP